MRAHDDLPEPTAVPAETPPPTAGRRRRPRWLIVLAALVLGAGVALATRASFADPADGADTLEARLRRAGASGDGATPQVLLEGLDIRRARPRNGRLEAELEDGRRAKLTIDNALQQSVRRMLANYAVPYAAVVALEPSTGRVLAYVSYSAANPAAGDLVLDGTPPAASVFKIITGAALVDAGVDPNARICFGGGWQRLEAIDLEENPTRDRFCSSLAGAMGGSINAIFARLASRHLNPDILGRYARAFGFGEAVPFDLPTRAADMEVPAEPLEFARTAAGFWHMHMSPLQAAVIGSVIANDGMMLRPQLVDEIVASDGSRLHRSSPVIVRRVISPATARTVNTMMQRTVTEGTSRRTFFDRQGTAFLPGITIAGKTGTLTGQTPYRGYTWWVGFAPAESPRIALAVVVVNTPIWRIKANFVARETLRAWFHGHPVSAASATSGDAAAEAAAADAGRD